MNEKGKEPTKGVAIPMEADPDVRVFSPMKYKIMLTLKKEGPSDLESLSKKLSISQMAVYKHIRELESKGLVEHESKRGGVGRPRLIFRPSVKSVGVYPTAYSELAKASLEALDSKLGIDSVKAVLRQLQTGTMVEYSSRIGEGGLEERVRRLAEIKDDHGFMTDVTVSNGAVELVEHNCPISAISAKYPEACEAERQMLERVLKAKVILRRGDTSGTTPCAFVVTPK
jgi:DeoR family transcriptional regulator, suf operon transcriptional repressor